MSRREVRVEFGSAREGITLVFTRAGLEVYGHYDSFVGFEGGSITWDDIDYARGTVNRVHSKGSKP
jgi:hypothetical protein